MNDIALTLPAEHHSHKRPRAGHSHLSRLRQAATYLAFALSVAFTFAVVIGVI